MSRKKIASKEPERASAPDEVPALVARFHDHADAYHAGRYNETQIRREFIDPFFKALGWDVWNEQGYAEAYKDVIHEDAIKVGGATKAPDYCFRIGGVRKFFIEAKKPSVDIKADAGPAFQLRRYAWSAKLPLSILTDFEELAVYDCRVKPVRTDKASTARVLYFRYDQYIERWNELASVFSREAILKGSFDKFAESSKRKRGTAEVDDAFLAEIEQWRDVLARNFALRNPGLTQRDLNFAVQRTIDRIVFLRICEDRGIEQYGTLLAQTQGEKVYQRLFERFRRADERYNSGLFHFEKEKGRPEQPDDLTPGLTLDNKPLKEIIKRLYYPDSPYEFSVLPADILGQVYEQFLGKVIRLTKGHRAVIEEKPEVRKAGGVYYTPTYIVDYIVKHTVGKLVEGKTPQQIGPDPVASAPRGGRRTTNRKRRRAAARPLTVLDPACGSGSFLLGAYQYLLDWYRDRYLEDAPKAHAAGASPRLFQHASGEWRLTTAERKRILLSHIHGVDIDSQAVETTKLSLLLKVLEGESNETIGSNLRLFHERALPDLSTNIKCGNSLIGPDFYDNHQMDMFDEEERLRINVFEWDAEFKEIMRSGGFDAVIGNPPYIRMEAFKELKEYLRTHYAVHGERADLYAYFVERAHHLVRANGTFGMILSNKFLKARYGRPLRDLLSHNSVERIVDFAGLPVFKGATVRTVILITSRGEPLPGSTLTYIPPPDREGFREIVARCEIVPVAAREKKISHDSLGCDSWTLVDRGEEALLHSLRERSRPLSEIVQGKVLWGVKTGLNMAFVIDAETRNAIVTADPRSAEIIKPFLAGEDVRRYIVHFSDRYLIYTFHGVNITQYPGVLDHLRPFKTRLKKRATKQEWYELQQPSVAMVPIFENPKIVYPEIAPHCRFVIDMQGYFGNNKTFVLPSADRSILGILNSQLALFYFSRTCAALEGHGHRYLEFRALYVRQFPVPLESMMSAPPVGAIERRVDRMLELHKQLATAKTAHARTAIQRQIDATDRQIDHLVYELYGLTDDEIRIVEKAREK